MASVRTIDQSVHHVFGLARSKLGVPVPNARVTVTDVVTGGRATVYSDEVLSTVANQPLTTGADGRYEFYVGPGRYTLAFTGNDSFEPAEEIDVGDAASGAFLPKAGGAMNPGAGITGGQVLVDRTKEAPVPPFFGELMTRSASPAVTGSMVDATFNLAADPFSLVVNDRYCLFFETGDVRPTTVPHFAKIYMGVTTDPVAGWPTVGFTKVSHDDAKHFVHPQALIHNGSVFCYYGEYRTDPADTTQTNGRIWVRSMPVSSFPAGAWSAATLALDTAAVTWPSRFSDNWCIVQWRGGWYFLAMDDNNDQKLYGRYCSHFTTDWLNDGIDIAPDGGPLFDLADIRDGSDWTQTATEMYPVDIGGDLYLVFGTKRKTDNKRALCAMAVTELTPPSRRGPGSFRGSWIKSDHSFPLAGSGWDASDIHTGHVGAYRGNWVLVYDARPTSPGSAANDWKIGVATMPIAGTPVAYPTGKAERIVGPGIDSGPLVVPDWRIGGKRLWAKAARQALDWSDGFQAVQTDSYVTSVAAAGTSKYVGAITDASGNVWFCPFNATTVGRYNPVTKVYDTPVTGLSASTSKWHGFAYFPNGIAYAFPFNNTDVLRLDTVAGTATTIGDLSAQTVARYHGTVHGADGRAHGVPKHASSIAVLDPSTDAITLVDLIVPLGNAFATADDKWWGGAPGPDGMIYFCPYSSGSIGRYNPFTGGVSLITAAFMAGAAMWAGCAVGADGIIYFAPYAANQVMALNVWTGVASLIGPDLSGLGATKWKGMVAGPGKKLYGISRDATSLLVVDTSTSPATVTTSALGPGSLVGNNKNYGGTLTPQGHIIGAPFSATVIFDLLTDVPGGIPTDLCTNRMANHL